MPAWLPNVEGAPNQPHLHLRGIFPPSNATRAVHRAATHPHSRAHDGFNPHCCRRPGWQLASSILQLAKTSGQIEYIVEYAPSSNSLKARDSLASKGDIRVRKTYDSAAFSGASIETETFDLDGLIALPEVANVWPNSIYKLEPVQALGSSVQAARLFRPQHHRRQQTARCWHPRRGCRGWNCRHRCLVRTPSCELSRLLHLAIPGDSTLIRALQLGGCIGPDCKVLGGYDLVGDAPWHPGLQKAPDSDPRDNQGHGTHVSGIVAGENDYWSGVAPKAKLRVYKVFSAQESEESDDETVIDAFLMAAADGCDIITCSIGNFNGWPQNAWAVVADRASRRWNLCLRLSW